jgi:2-polyprenyl-3-methyl-5-hydroxy-6-metoxy-1,4-benzoquinol methylase
MNQTTKAGIDPASDASAPSTAPQAPAFVPHTVEWTREKSARFWDHMGPLTARSGTYFSGQLGRPLLRFVRKAGVPLSGRIMDFGCGLGHLIGYMLDDGLRAGGADFSPDAVAHVRDTFGGRPNFDGAELISSLPSALPTAGYDVVFLLETVEHLLPDDLDATVQELHRILKPGGWVVVSTPNEENLQTAQVLCPDCGATFHSVQHVRTWSADSLSAFMSRHGFRRHRAEGTYLAPTRLLMAALRVGSKRRPHLIYVGRKASA